MSQLPAVAQWAGLAIFVVGGFLAGIGFGLAALGAVLVVVGYTAEPES